MAKQRVTLVQVAKDAGVSPATVSHFMNGNFHRMGPETREKISDSITRLGYQVNPVAKSLITGKMHTIGLVLSNSTYDGYFEDLYFLHFAKVLKQHLKTMGYKLILLDFDEIFMNIQMVDGIIVKATLETEKFMPRLMDLNVPVITIGRHNLPYGAHIVRVNDYQCGQTGVDHLMSRGYHKIIILTYPHGQVPGFDDRLNGASQSLQEKGNLTTVITGDMTESFGYETVTQLAGNGQLPQALFCLNDISAIGVLKACKDLKLSVPEDLAVLGVDDMPTVSELLSLSTIRHPINELAMNASELMIQSIEWKGEPAQPVDRMFPIELMARHTS
ncbi:MULTISPECIES: LacI family DNA-binding transcriptional regulator [unclassified Paenibacillus]|jgi:LacI family transcriptional regulator|uniref:LacI family DNA-binding transcriptional regulator n=1 Tax=unclassified Paenibacillus TaxID=185978 RepID=UPI00096C569D|nr:LacI family DNA-binding transcriptional regulator [Paenibacillus sp. FSL H8-0259]OMF31286.1 LacI family transcriptional regulator [Paenibacillus sp. FSL H8-0259]